MFIALLVRVAYILSANTIGELGQELVYLRMDALRLPLWIGGVGLLFEILEFGHDALVLAGWFEPVASAALYVNAAQSLAFLTSGALLYRAIRPYSPGGIERRIEENMETLALLAGQRRRRRTGERSERSEGDGGRKRDGERKGGRDREREERRRERTETN